MLCVGKKTEKDLVSAAHSSSHSNAPCLQSAQTEDVENLPETLSLPRGSESFECSSKVKQDTDRALGNGINPDIHGNSTGEPGANSAERNLLQLRHWQRKYPGRKIVPHVCTACGRQFLQAVQLRKHMIKHAQTDDSGVEFPYTCYACRRHFLFANDLRRHLISHSDDRPHRCLVCGRPFKREDDLSKHMRTHGDVRPYQCDECEERLESSSKLRRHMRRVHRDRFECPHCRAFFTRRGLLARHKRERHPGLLNSSLSLTPCNTGNVRELEVGNY